MFWGLTLEPGKRYAQQVETSFHISMAALDVRASSNEPVSVVVEIDRNEFILCNLNKQHQMQQAMDLNFMKMDQIAFTVKGKGTVHLTGYIVPDDMEDFEDMEEEEGSDDEAPMLQPAKAIKGMPDDKKRKGATPESKGGPAAKKMREMEKVMMMNGDGDDSDDESEDDDSDEVDDEEDDSDDDGGLLDDEAEEGEDEEDDDEEDGEEEEDDSSEEEMETPQKPVQKQKTPQSQKIKQEQKTPTNQKKMNGAATPKEQSAKKGEQKQTPKQSPKAEAKTPGTPGNKKTLHGGVVVEDLVVGSGPPAASGKQAAVYYVGRNKHNNKQFDATQSGPPFKFRLGKGEVIKGWDIGVQGMKVGGKRRVICPPHMAYGNKGSPPVIPPNSTLVFDIELKGVS